jgi:hypothetical protein
LPILERDVETKRALKSEVSAERLIELATGWEYVPEPGIRRVVLIPSYVLRPWVSFSEHHDVKIFCYPAAGESIAADSNEPSARLVRLTKALSDPGTLPETAGACEKSGIKLGCSYIPRKSCPVNQCSCSKGVPGYSSVECTWRIVSWTSRSRSAANTSSLFAK